MTTVEWEQTTKQLEAWEYLTDQTTTELLFGGGAGGAKSFLGCAWLIIMCGSYPGTRWLMGRSKLSSLKQTTYRTFLDVARMFQMKNGYHFKVNHQSNEITFRNGSTILMKDLYQYPSDPDFDNLGSLEITGAFIDEANQITVKARNIVMSRIRYRLDEYGLIPKMLMTCNPAKNWVYMDFYKPFKNASIPEELRKGPILPAYRRFVQALAKDNKFVSKHYIENLMKLDPISKERLLFGNWEYDDDPAKMFDITTIADMFTLQTVDYNKIIPQRFLSVDVARMGADTVRIGYWHNLQLKRIVTMSKKRIPETVAEMEKICTEERIPRSHVVVDEDGVGGGVVDGFKGCVGFLNGGRPIYPEGTPDNEKNYLNLRSQCYFKLAQLTKDALIGLECNTEDREMITEELEQIKQAHIDADTKLAVIPKEQIKESLGRSPDLSDMLMMRMYYEVSRAGFVHADKTMYTKSETVAGNLFKVQF